MTDGSLRKATCWFLCLADFANEKFQDISASTFDRVLSHSTLARAPMCVYYECSELITSGSFYSEIGKEQNPSD